MAPTTRSSKPKKSPGSKKKNKQKRGKSEPLEGKINYIDDESDILSDDSLDTDSELEELAQQTAERMTDRVHALGTGRTPPAAKGTPARGKGKPGHQSGETDEDLDGESVIPFVVDVESNVKSKITVEVSHIADTTSKFSDLKNVKANIQTEDFLSFKQPARLTDGEDKEVIYMSLEVESAGDKNVDPKNANETQSQKSGKGKRKKKIKLASVLDPGIDFNDTYLTYMGKASRKSTKSAQAVLIKSSNDKLLKNSILSEDFEKRHSVPPYRESVRQLQRQKKKERESKTGDAWYNMAAVEMTDELRNDIKAIRMRASLDPKRFYKHNDMKALPKFVQVGTVVESAADFYHSRIPKKQRKQTIVEELLADADTRRYNKRKYMELQERQKRSGPRGSRGKKGKKSKK